MSVDEKQTARDVVVGMYEAAAAGDGEKALSTLSPSLVVHEPDYLPFGGRYEGIEGFIAVVGEVGKYIDMSRLSVERVAAEGDVVVVTLSVPLVQEPGEVLMVEELRVEDGRIAEIRVYWADLPASVAAGA